MMNPTLVTLEEVVNPNCTAAFSLSKIEESTKTSSVNTTLCLPRIAIDESENYEPCYISCYTNTKFQSGKQLLGLILLVLLSKGETSEFVSFSSLSVNSDTLIMNT